MARAFDDASSQYLANTSAVPIASQASTIAAWYYADDSTSFTWFDICCVCSGSDGTYLRLARQTDGSNLCRIYANARNDGNTDAQATHSAGVNDINVWHHAAAVFASTTSRWAYYDGSGTENTTSVADNFTNLSETVIGARGWSGARARYWSGNLAEIGMWNVALTAAEIGILAKGVSPLMVRPGNLVLYVPLVRDADKDIIGGISFTAFNTPTVAAHPRVFYPALPVFQPSAAAAANTGPLPMFRPQIS